METLIAAIKAMGLPIRTFNFAAFTASEKASLCEYYIATTRLGKGPF